MMRAVTAPEHSVADLIFSESQEKRIVQSENIQRKKDDKNNNNKFLIIFHTREQVFRKNSIVLHVRLYESIFSEFYRPRNTVSLPWFLR